MQDNEIMWELMENEVIKKSSIRFEIHFLP